MRIKSHRNEKNLYEYGPGTHKMTKEFKEVVHKFLALYEQANELPVIRPMSNSQSSYLLSIAVDILRHIDEVHYYEKHT